jgi:hypothetical protein
VKQSEEYAQPLRRGSGDSMYTRKTDSIALRTVLRASWLRRAGATALVSGVAW